MKFKYQARTKDGLVQIGIIKAPTKEKAISVLQSQGFYITYLEEEKQQFVFLKTFLLRQQVSRRELMNFSRQLSMLLAAGISLVESLRTIAFQTRKKIFREALLQITEEVESGTYFSDALSKYPRIFSQFYINMVKSGETTGRLSQALQYLADHLEKEYLLIEKIKNAVSYPAFVLIMLVAVVSFMFFYVFPQIKETFEPLGIVFPPITLFLFSMGEFFKQWGWLLLLALVIFIFGAWKYFHTKEGKELIKKILPKIPLIGPLSIKIYLTQLSENLSTLIYAGLPLTQALEITERILETTVYKDIIQEIKTKIRKGESLSNAFKGDPVFLPSLVVQMIKVGEKTGRLDEALAKVGDFYRQEVERSIESLTRLIEPLLITFVGVFVGLLMISIFLPIYSNIGRFGF